jgi:hypothetical protein
MCPSKAEAAGYAAVGECVTGPGGAMGVHYLNGRLLGDPKLDLKKPELLPGRRPVVVHGAVEAPPQEARRALAAVQLHPFVWTVRKNPRGTFAQYNRRVSCDAG